MRTTVYGTTCLHISAMRGHLPVAQHLAGLLCGRLLPLLAAGGETAAELADAAGHLAVRYALLAAGAA